MTPLLVVAGEASGDLHGARLLAELHRRLPGVEAFGLGGDEMAATGFDAVAHSSEIAVVGLVEALKVVPRARVLFHRLLAEAERRQARWAVLIDSPDFNLRLARQLHRRGIRVIYYISPQVWAWRRRRVRAIARWVDRMLVLFPFEEEFYRRHQVEVSHVGHPLVDEIPRLESAWQRPGEGDGPFRVALLPGSRRSEVRSLLLPMLEAGKLLADRLPVELRLIQAPTLDDAYFAEVIGDAAVPPYEAVRRERYRAIADCHLALCASGTAALETGLLGTPLIVLYRLAPWTYHLARLLVDLESFSMVNLVLGEKVVPELLQHETEPQRVAELASRLLGDRAAIDRMRGRLAELRPRLGSSGASGRAADEVARLIGGGAAA